MIRQKGGIAESLEAVHTHTHTHTHTHVYICFLLKNKRQSKERATVLKKEKSKKINKEIAVKGNYFSMSKKEFKVW